MLQRTPYNRAGATEPVKIASHGYVVVMQDTRGRFGAEGEFYPFRYESQDGYDTVEWAAALPYADGQVGMFGGSYVGATQMLAAIAAPPAPDSIFPYVTASEYYPTGGLTRTACWSSGSPVHAAAWRWTRSPPQRSC